MIAISPPLGFKLALSFTTKFIDGNLYIQGRVVPWGKNVYQVVPLNQNIKFRRIFSGKIFFNGRLIPPKQISQDGTITVYKPVFCMPIEGEKIINPRTGEVSMSFLQHCEPDSMEPCVYYIPSQRIPGPSPLIERKSTAAFEVIKTLFVASCENMGNESLSHQSEETASEKSSFLSDTPSNWREMTGGKNNNHRWAQYASSLLQRIKSAITQRASLIKSTKTA